MSEGKNLIGVDIGSSSIKVCEVSENRKGERTLVRFGFHPLPAQTVVDGHVMNSAAVVEGLEKLFHKAKRRDVAVRVSGHSVIIKKITLPLMTPQELAEQINWEAEQHIPFDLSEVQIDYEVLQQRQDQGQMEVLLVAAKREEITDLTTLVAEARLRTKVVDLDAFALQNCYESIYGPVGVGQNVVLLHVGASLTTLNILSQGTTAFTRDIARGGHNITEEIQRSLGVDYEEAEQFKCGTHESGRVPQQLAGILQHSMEELAGEVQRSLDFYLATSGNHDIHKIYVSGGSANSTALTESIGRRSRVAIEPLDCLRLAPPDTKTVDMSMLQGRVAHAAVAAGLSLRKERERKS